MVVDAVRTYFDAANGLTELSRRDAVAAARTLLRSGSRTAAVTAEGEQAPRVGQSIQALAGELIEANRANRSAVVDLVREEVGRQMESVDVVPRSEYERLSRRVAELERRLAARHALEQALAVPADGSIGPALTTDRSEFTPEPESRPGAAPVSAPAAEADRQQEPEVESAGRERNAEEGAGVRTRDVSQQEEESGQVEQTEWESSASSEKSPEDDGDPQGRTEGQADPVPEEPAPKKAASRTAASSAKPAKAKTAKSRTTTKRNTKPKAKK